MCTPIRVHLYVYCAHLYVYCVHLCMYCVHLYVYCVHLCMYCVHLYIYCVQSKASKSPGGGKRPGTRGEKELEPSSVSEHPSPAAATCDPLTQAKYTEKLYTKVS